MTDRMDAMSPTSAFPSVSTSMTEPKLPNQDVVDNRTPARDPGTTSAPPREVPRMYKERERFETFRDSWPVPFITPKQMAAAGFYFTRHDDIVKCAFCGVEVGRWVVGDDPMADHKKWSPACKFVRNIEVGNVPITDQSQEPGSDSDYDTCGHYGIKPAVKQGDNISVEKLGVQKSRAPKFPDFATYDSRLQSFSSWPISLRLKPKSLSDAGFYYTGKGDQTVCFHCGGGLKDWEENDNPWVEHARWFSKCNYVLLVKGKDFVDEVCGRKFLKTLSENLDFMSPRLSSSTGDLEKQSTSAMETVMRKDSVEEGISNSCASTSSAKTTDNDARLCKICYENERNVVFLPCGHLVACAQCAVSLTTCAVCRNPFTATLRAYIS